ncbi:AAA family ATPase [Sorangium atrum]|uniref:AAA family ATPase n=1 Tax=Sorangium atrum TaxID=2995308 RepID=A0ABT5C4C9_9BACT|nr:AAA family ATPase [Sorangium aterium]MDC0681268.1 AAA family ATPase [Sorangium aterium]
MASLSTESTPRERLDRAISVLGRVRMYWRGAAAMMAVGLAISLALALATKRVWRSEATILYRDTIQTGRDPQSGTARAARLGSKLKDALTARGTLAGVVEAFGLYPEKSARSMVEAVEEMKTHVGFRAQSSDTYVVSFTHDDPHVAQQVAARLTQILLDDYRRDSLGTATMTRDFLRKELAEASSKVDAASRALATFLARNPQFQWGLNDSPYAPTPQPLGSPGAPATAAARALPAQPARPADPQLAALERQLARVEALLGAARSPAVAPGQPLPQSVVEAQRARTAAVAAVASAEAALAEKLTTVTPIHPDAVAAKRRVEAAKSQLAAAESALGLVRAGVTEAPAGEERALTPARRAALAAERTALLRQIAGLRVRAAGGRASSGGEAPRAPAESAARGEAPRAPPWAADGAAEERVIELETEWHRLRLDLERAREYLKTVQANERAADLSADAAENKSETELDVLDQAYLPSRPDRGRGRVFFAGAAVTFFFALGVAGARVLLNDTLYDGGDIHALGGPALLAAMPELPARPPLRERTIVPAYCAEPLGGPGYGAEPSGGPGHGAEPPGAAGPGAEPPGEARHGAEPSSAAGPGAEPLGGYGHGAEPPGAPEEAAPAGAVPDPEDTLRDGLDLGDCEVVDRSSWSAPEAPLACVGVRSFARVGSPALDGPEVVMIGADLDPEGHGVFELLRGAPAPALAALRVLRHRLDQRRAGEPLAVAVVSPGRAEGKTALAVRLAMTLAEAERARVLLVDGHLACPRVAATLGLRLPAHASFSEQLRRRMAGEIRPLGVIAVSQSLSVLAEPSLEASYPAALHSVHFEAAMRTLRRYHDYVVIDGPPVLGSGDANVIEDAADGIVLVARASLTRASSLTRAAEQLGDRRILGVVLNDVAPRPVVRKRICIDGEPAEQSA